MCGVIGGDHINPPPMASYNCGCANRSLNGLLIGLGILSFIFLVILYYPDPIQFIDCEQWLSISMLGIWGLILFEHHFATCGY